MSQKRHIIIVGGGASGLTAAVMAAEQGCSVTVLEHNERIGRKLCVTGNGRCNLTNLNFYEGAYRGNHPEFAREILRQFSLEDTLEFFESIGLPVTDRNGWLYPRSGQAKCVPELLEWKARSLRVKIKTKEHVTKIFKKNGLWNVKTESWSYQGNAVILANGSKASSVSGADGSGYELSAGLGHKIIKPLPALVSLKCRGNGFSGWAGVRTEAEATLTADGKILCMESGEVQLTDYGISGIPVFQLSRFAVRACEEGKKTEIFLNFLPEYEEDQIEKLFRRRRERCPYKSVPELFTGLFPDRLCRILLKQKDPLKAARSFHLEVTGHSGFSQAQICSGGIDTQEVNPHTLESKIHKDLYFAGELLDIDGACGGYNLQWAWSSGAVAGIHSAKESL